MSARQLFYGASFGPNTLTALGEAFDAAWVEMAGNFCEPADIETARNNLANALLSVASEDSRDVEVLKRAALLLVALDYPQVVLHAPAVP
jgi:hypothetical protein